MLELGHPMRLGFAAVVVASMFPGGASAAESGDVVLAPHRAVYDLTLGDARGKSSVQAVRGRILYDFSGSVCHGYDLRFRQVSELDSGEGKTALSDLRSTTWEDGAAKTFRFNSQNSLNNQVVETTEGRAERRADAVAVALAKPEEKAMKLEAHVVFPTEHMRRIIAAARAGKTVLELPVYDGSETGQKLYDTLTIIGRTIAPDQRKPTDAAAGQSALAELRRWPVTISYFDRDQKSEGEQTPVYALSVELYENGISRALLLDYNEFVVAAKLSSLEIQDQAPCK
ncbi:MAG: cell envelope integrity EipB family protein [Xanthobacteraceae bacterium]